MGAVSGLRGDDVCVLAGAAVRAAWAGNVPDMVYLAGSDLDMDV